MIATPNCVCVDVCGCVSTSAFNNYRLISTWQGETQRQDGSYNNVLLNSKSQEKFSDRVEKQLLKWIMFLYILFASN